VARRLSPVSKWRSCNSVSASSAAARPLRLSAPCTNPWRTAVAGWPATKPGRARTGKALPVAVLLHLLRGRGRPVAARVEAPQVAANRAATQLHRAAELVGAGKPLPAVLAGRDGEDERAAIGTRSAAGVPILIGHRAEPRIFFRQAAQGGVDSLLLRTDQTNLHLTAVGRAKTWGRSIAVSVIPSNWNRSL